MKRVLVITALLALAVTFGISQQITPSPQGKAEVQLEKHKDDSLHAGDPVAFTVKLNAPLPKGARFIMRISPISADQQVELHSGQGSDDSRTKFRVTGKLPDEAISGKWHIAVIYLFLPGASWTSNTIKPNDLTFEVEGKHFPIPTTADVSIDN